MVEAKFTNVLTRGVARSKLIQLVWRRARVHSVHFFELLIRGLEVEKLHQDDRFHLICMVRTERIQIIIKLIMYPSDQNGAMKKVQS